MFAIFRNKARLRASAEADHWINRLAEGSASTQMDFTAWLTKSPDNVREYLTAMALHEMVSPALMHEVSPQALGICDESVGAVLARRRQVAAELRWAVRSQSSGSKRGLARLRITPLRIASAAAVILAFVAWRLVPGWIGSTAVYHTQRGALIGQALEDGSVMDLGALTSMTVTMSAHARSAQLKNGTVVFQVKKDRTRPFRVQAANVVAEAVGTAFGVEHDGTRTVVTVTEGRVMVKESCGYKSFRPGARGSSEGILVNASYRLVFEDTTCRVRPQPESLSQNELDRSFSWRKQEFWFDKDELHVAVERFNQYNETQLEIVDPSIRNQRVSGHFNVTDLESFIQALRLQGVSATKQSERSDATVLLEAAPKK